MEYTNLFDDALCYEWFENVIHGREEAAAGDNRSDDGAFDYPNEFSAALQSLKSPPAIRAAGPYMLRVLNEWLGADDDRLITLARPVVDTLCVRLVDSDAEPISSRFVTSVLFSLLCVFDIYQWDIGPVAELYWALICALILANDFTDLQKLISPMITSLILKTTHTAQQVRLSRLVSALENGHINLAKGCLNTEAGQELLRRVLETFAAGYRESDQDVLESFVSELTRKAVHLSTNPEHAGVLYPLSAASSIVQVRPIITLSSLVFRICLSCLNQRRAKTRESQLASTRMLKALAIEAPQLLVEDEAIRHFYAEVHEDAESDTENLDPSNQNCLHKLKITATSPWIAFVAMVLCTLPERRDCRERACAILIDSLGNAPSTFLSRLLGLVKMLSAFHERGSVRLAATELLASLSYKVGSVEALRDDLLRRTSDTNAIVRARALELLAHSLAGRAMSKLDTTRVPTDCAATPQIAVSHRKGSSVAALPQPCEERLLRALRARVLDGKSVVRKGSITVLEVLFQKELAAGVLTAIDDAILEVLADDIVLTVRQRFASAMVNTLNFWLTEEGPGNVSQAALVLTHLCRLAMDAEEVVYNRVLESVESMILPALRKGCSTEGTRCSTLYRAVATDEQMPEYFQRALIRLLEVRYSETSAWNAGEFGTTLNALCACARDNHSFHVLYLLVSAAHRGLSRIAGGSLGSQIGAACLAIYEEAIPWVGGDEHIELCTTGLDFLIHAAPLHVDVKNRKLIFDSLYNLLLEGHVHSALVLRAALLSVVIMPKEQVATTCMAYLSNGKRLLSRFKIPTAEGESASDPGVNPRHLANACLLCGFSAAVQLSLKDAKLGKFLQQMIKALAVTILSICRYHSDPRVKAIALVAVSHVLLLDEQLAKKHMSKVVQTALGLGPHSAAATNTAFVTYDVSVCITAVMDPYLTLVTSCLAESYGASVETRFSILLLISQLAGLDFIKCKGLMMHHVIYALGDSSPEVAELAYSILQTILLPRLKDLILVYFAETICFLNGYYNHPGAIRPADFIHPLQRDVSRNYEQVNIQAFVALSDETRRYAIYRKLLSVSHEQSKHLLTTKLVQDFLKPLVSFEEQLPLDTSEPCGQAVADVLAILSSADMKLRFKSLGATDETAAAGEAAESAAKAKYERDLMSNYITQNVVPVLIVLYQALRSKNSALQRNVIDSIAATVAELDCHMADLVTDKALRRRVEERMRELPAAGLGSLNPLDDGRRRRL